jgi:YjjI family glycine radical enzyme
MYGSETDNYCVASCYNVLPVGGGGYTLGRMNLRYLAELNPTREELMDGLLKDAVLAQCEIIDKRIQFIVEDCKYFENCFLAQEGLISQDRFIGMFGIVGLAELVNGVLKAEKPEERYGTGEEANAFTEEILDYMHGIVEAYKPKYEKIRMHGQVGISTDVGTTPNVRVPVGEEPDFYSHLTVTARMQKNFECGVGDLFPFDATAKKNPHAVLDVIKGAFSMNMRYFSLYSSDTDVIRVTGYLVKLSEVEEYRKGKAVLDSTTVFGSGAKDGLKIMSRKVRGFDHA